MHTVAFRKYQKKTFHSPICIYGISSGVLTISPKEHCLPFRVRVSVRAGIRVRVDGQLSSVTIVLEPFKV